MKYFVAISSRRSVHYNLMSEDRARLLAQLYVPEQQPEVSENQELFRFTPSELTRYSNIFFADSEAYAKAIAQAFAEENPGMQIYWGTLNGAFECVPGKPVEKTISDKGILPA